MSTVHDHAHALLQAYERGPIPPLSRSQSGLTLDDAYAVQVAQVRHWTQSGRRLIGHKIGLTSLAMQRLLGVDEPDYGHLFADMEYDQNDSVELDRFIAARVEPEIGFILGADLTGTSVTVEEARAAVRWVVPALEIVDSRIVDWQITLEDTIADNASSAGFVLGSARIAPTDLDLANVSCVMSLNGRPAGEGRGDDVMGTPLQALAWLVRTLTARGVRLRAGDLVLPGAVCAMVPVERGDTVRAVFSDLGEVQATFT